MKKLLCKVKGHRKTERFAVSIYGKEDLKRWGFCTRCGAWFAWRVS